MQLTTLWAVRIQLEYGHSLTLRCVQQPFSSLTRGSHSFALPLSHFIFYIAVYLALSQSSYVVRDHIHNDPPTHIPLFLTLIIKLIYVYSLSIPRILRANCISLGMIVTLLPCIAHRLASSNNATKCASLASCNASIALPCHR